MIILVWVTLSWRYDQLIHYICHMFISAGMFTTHPIVNRSHRICQRPSYLPRTITFTLTREGKTLQSYESGNIRFEVPRILLKNGFIGTGQRVKICGKRKNTTKWNETIFYFLEIFLTTPTISFNLVRCTRGVNQRLFETIPMRIRLKTLQGVGSG